MRNPLLVFLSSVDHQSHLLNKVYSKIGIYKLMLPHVFEYYCVFCRRICNCWWEDYWRSDEPQHEPQPIARAALSERSNMDRIDFRLRREEKQKLRDIACYYDLPMTTLIKKWIKYDGPEGFRQSLKLKFT